MRMVQAKHTVRSKRLTSPIKNFILQEITHEENLTFGTKQLTQSLSYFDHIFFLCLKYLFSQIIKSLGLFPFLNRKIPDFQCFLRLSDYPLSMTYFQAQMTSKQQCCGSWFCSAAVPNESWLNELCRGNKRKHTVSEKHLVPWGKRRLFHYDSMLRGEHVNKSVNGVITPQGRWDAREGHSDK